jgi:2-haloacid dehalogenase
MKPSRRRFLGAAAATSISYAAHSLRADGHTPVLRRAEIRAVAFDAFVIFSPAIVFQRAEEMFPGRGSALWNLWRTRQFEYTWLRTIGQRYRDFWHVTEDALDHAANVMTLKLSGAEHDHLMNAYRELPLWPDTYEALTELRRLGVRLAFLSNFTAGMLDANLERSKLRKSFEEHLTTDRVSAFKPSPHAYQMGIDHFGFQREEIAFAASAPWDAVGAKWFGYPTLWINRAKASEESLGVTPDVTANSIRAVVELASEAPQD